MASKTTQKPAAKPVPETLHKKTKTVAEQAAAYNLRALARHKRARLTKGKIYQRAEQYVREYRTKERQLIHLKRKARRTGNFYLPDEAKLAFVIRIKGTQGMHPKPRKILQLLRLRQINNGVFVRLTAATRKMLTLVEPYVTYGYPTLSTVRQLVYKRGHAKFQGQRIPLTENTIVEKALKRQNIICVEDLIHEIFTVGPHFREANKFLWTFKLNAPTGGWNRLRNHYVEGGDAGNREDKINELVSRMN
eukprot:TRINITY_DN2170_c0_g1_i1.p2 TRINITY_DN2170_c0_g1~~TRINITY_DN2170_c0_g1_i1.p2  ORF type:complete len:249 (+),score=76.37 TRINITY_DN2170_c0_g1_i1:50-796(+)